MCLGSLRAKLAISLVGLGLGVNLPNAREEGPTERMRGRCSPRTVDAGDVRPEAGMSLNLSGASKVPVATVRTGAAVAGAAF